MTTPTPAPNNRVLDGPDPAPDNNANASSLGLLAQSLAQAVRGNGQPWPAGNAANMATLAQVASSPPIVSVTSERLTPTGDQTGQQDEARLLTGLGNTGRDKLLEIGPGNFYYRKPLPVSIPGITFRGSGQGSTILNLIASFSDPDGTRPGSLSWPALLQIGTGLGANANLCQVSDLGINSLMTYGGPVAANLINNWGCGTLTLSNLRFQNANGLAYQAHAAAVGSRQIVRGQYHDLTVDNCAGGFHLRGQPLGSPRLTVNSQASNWTFVGGNLGVPTGPAAYLDSVFFENGFDFVGVNINPVIGSDGRCSTHLKDFGVCWLTNLNAGGSSTLGLWMEGSSQASIAKASYFYYEQGGLIEGNSSARLEDCWFENSKTSGLKVTSTATNGQVVLEGCQFGYAGNGGNGRHAGHPTDAVYDLDWSGTVQGRVSNTTFGSGIRAQGIGNGVQRSVNLPPSNRVAFWLAKFNGSPGGATPSNWFTNPPHIALVDTPAGAVWHAGRPA